MEFATWLNVFQFCKWLRYLGHVMVLLVLGIVGFSWWAVVPATYGPLLVTGSPLEAMGAAVAILAFSALVGMLVWSYFEAVSTDPGGVPPGWHPFCDDQEAAWQQQRLSVGSPAVDRRDPRRPRYCKRCQAWKPERSHHCSVSGRCILRMDHWCIWVINCVGLLNYKAFLLFLVYTFLASLLGVALLIKPVVDFFTGPPLSPGLAVAFIALVLDSAFVAAVGGFLVMHWQLVAANCTTIEMYEKERCTPWPFDKGTRRNFEEVFGKKRWRWLVPSYTREERAHLLDSCLKPLTVAHRAAPAPACPVGPSAV